MFDGQPDNQTTRQPDNQTTRQRRYEENYVKKSEFKTVGRGSKGAICL